MGISSQHNKASKHLAAFHGSLLMSASVIAGLARSKQPQHSGLAILTLWMMP